MTSREDKTAEIFRKYPKMFRPGGIFISCHEGWFGLIDQLCGCAQSYYDDNHGHNQKLSQPRISEIKEKYGRLSIVLDGGDEFIDGMVWFAEYLSTSICEITGGPGRLCQKDGWYKTLSADKAQEMGFNPV